MIELTIRMEETGMTRINGGRGRALPAVLLACGLAVSACGSRDVQPVNGGPPISPFVAARPDDVQWANALCTTLNPLFAALNPPPSAAAPSAYQNQITLAQQRLDQVQRQMYTVGPPPSTDAGPIVVAIDNRLNQVGQRLSAAAGQFAAPNSADAGASETARAALTSFDRAELKPLLDADLSLANALRYAPACVQQP